MKNAKNVDSLKTPASAPALHHETGPIAGNGAVDPMAVGLAKMLTDYRITGRMDDQTEASFMHQVLTLANATRRRPSVIMAEIESISDRWFDDAWQKLQSPVPGSLAWQLREFVGGGDGSDC